MKYVQIERMLKEQQVLPKLLSCEEASILTYLTPARLDELGRAGFAPCVRIDGGPPLFFKPDLLAWLKENLIQVHSGKALAAPFVIHSADAMVPPNEIPPNLRRIADQIQEYRGYDQPAVYFLLKAGVITYVGQSYRLGQRIIEHVRLKDFDRVFYLAVPESQLYEVERMFIAALRPPLNVQNMPEMPPGELTRGTLVESS